MKLETVEKMQIEDRICKNIKKYLKTANLLVKELRILNTDDNIIKIAQMLQMGVLDQDIRDLNLLLLNQNEMEKTKFTRLTDNIVNEG